MDFSEYQRRAAETDRHPGKSRDAVEIPLLGLSGEVGTLLSQYKKYLRDGDAHELFEEKIAEELGDILWYLSNAATKFDIDLEDIAQRNLAKVIDRWGSGNVQGTPRFFDDGFPINERLPRWFEAVFSEQVDDKGQRRVFVTSNEKQIGDFLTDNANSPDGYRFHDAFHFAYACILGWSPVTRRNLNLKRKSRTKVDEVEDGARAIIYEEAVSGIVFEDARNHRFYETKHTLDFSLLDSIKRLTAHLEVHIRSRSEWEKAILRGFDIWRSLANNGGGVVRYDLEQREITYLGKTGGTQSS